MAKFLGKELGVASGVVLKAGSQDWWHELTESYYPVTKKRKSRVNSVVSPASIV